MSRKVIRLSEHELRTLIKESVNEILNEIGYRKAALTHGANYNAMTDKITNNNPNAMSKADRSNNVKLAAITMAVNDNFPNLILPFMEEGNGEFYSVVLDFNDVASIDASRFVLRGKLTISGKRTQTGCVEYNFSSGSFYRVIIMANGAIRRTKQIAMDPDGKDTFDRLLTFMSNYVYSREDYENEVNVNGSTPSKFHKP